MGRENDPQKSQKSPNFIKSYFELKQRVLGGLLSSAKVTAAKFCVEFWYWSLLCGHFWPFIILKPVALARVKHRALYFLRVGPADAFIVMKRGSHISVRISQTNFSCFTDPPKCPLKVGVFEVRKVCQTHRFEVKAYLSSSYEVKKFCATASAQTVQFSRSRQK